MPYMQIRIIQWKMPLRSDQAQEMIQHAQTEAIPLLKQQPGFLRFEITSLGPHITAGILVWETEQAARQGIDPYIDWLEQRGGLEQTDSLQRFHGKVLVSSDLPQFGSHAPD